MGSLVGEGLDLKTVGIGSRKKRVGLTGRRAGSVALAALLSPTGSEGNLSAESDSSKSRELHFAGNYWFRLVQRGRRGDNGWSWIWWMLKGRWWEEGYELYYEDITTSLYLEVFMIESSRARPSSCTHAALYVLVTRRGAGDPGCNATLRGQRDIK